MLKVLFTLHAAVLAANQKYISHLAAEPDLQVTLLIPPCWDESTSMVEAHIPATDSPYIVRIDQVKKAFRGLSFRYKNIRATLKEEKPDVIFLYEEPYSYVAWQVLYWKQKICPQAKLIFYTWQNLDCKYSLLHKLAEKYVFKHSDLGVAGSLDVENVLRLHGYNKQIRRIPLALDPTDFALVDGSTLRKELQLHNFTLGYIGRLAKEKGLEDLFQALALLSDRPWQLLMIGSGPDESALRSLANRLCIADKITWIPYVKNTEMYRYYPAMDAFILPSRTTVDWKEQFGRVLIEAMICRTPVIGSSSGEIPLVIGDAGLVFPEQDAQSLANCIVKLMDNPDMRQNFSELGRTRVLEHFTWERIAQQTAKILREVADRRSE